MTKFARFLLVLTSLAPIFVVRAAVAFDNKQRELGTVLLLVVALLVLVCLGLLVGVGTRTTPTPRQIAEPSAKDSEPVAFFVAYALPLLSAAPGAHNLWGLTAFAAITALATYQLEIYYVNPLLALLGYKFHGAKADNGAQVLIVSRDRTLASGMLHVVEASRYLWIRSDHKGGASGSVAGLAAGSNSPPS